MPNTTTYDFGDVLLMEVEYTNQRQSEKRPVVVVSTSLYNQSHPDIVVMPITSQSHHSDTIAIKDWQTAGLHKLSYVKPVIGTYEQVMVIKRLGKIADASTRLGLKKALASIFGFKQATPVSSPT
jgi:mRNA interferase MazF